MLELKSWPGWPGGWQQEAGFSPVQLALGVEAGTEEMLEEGRGREEGWDGIGVTWVTKGAVKTNSCKAITSGEV